MRRLTTQPYNSMMKLGIGVGNYDLSSSSKNKDETKRLCFQKQPGYDVEGVFLTGCKNLYIKNFICKNSITHEWFSYIINYENYSAVLYSNTGTVSIPDIGGYSLLVGDSGSNYANIYGQAGGKVTDLLLKDGQLKEGWIAYVEIGVIAKPEEY